MFYISLTLTIWLTLSVLQSIGEAVRDHHSGPIIEGAVAAILWSITIALY